MLRPVSEVADIGTGRPSRRSSFPGQPATQGGFGSRSFESGSVEFVEDAVEHGGLFFFDKKAGAQRFIIDARANHRHFVRPLLTGEGLCHAEFLGARGDAQNYFVGSVDFKNAFHQMRIPASLF